MFLGSIAWYVVNIISLSLVGTTGTVDELAALGLGNVVVNVLGASVIRGFASGIGTLSSQAYGARELTQVGEYARRATAVLMLTMLPIAASCWWAEEMMLALGQEKNVARLINDFTRARIPGLVCYSIYTVVTSTLNVMGRTSPGMYASVAAAVVAVPLSFLAIDDLGLALQGAAYVQVCTHIYNLISMSGLSEPICVCVYVCSPRARLSCYCSFCSPCATMRCGRCGGRDGPSPACGDGASTCASHYPRA